MFHLLIENNTFAIYFFYGEFEYICICIGLNWLSLHFISIHGSYYSHQYLKRHEEFLYLWNKRYWYVINIKQEYVGNTNSIMFSFNSIVFRLNKLLYIFFFRYLWLWKIHKTANFRWFVVKWLEIKVGSKLRW